MEFYLCIYVFHICFGSSRDLWTVFKLADHFPPHQSSMKTLISPHSPILTMDMVYISDYLLLMGMKCHLIVVLVYIFLMTNDNEPFFMSLLSFLNLLWRQFFRFFAYILINWIILLLNCKNSLGIQELSLLWHIIYTAFSYSVRYLFLDMVSMEAQTFLTLDWAQQHPIMERGGVHVVLSFPEELQAINGFWGGKTVLWPLVSCM